MKNKSITPASLPETGFVRLPEILAVFPVSPSVWWDGVRSGRYPKGIKLSARCTAWPAEDIHALITSVKDSRHV